MKKNILFLLLTLIFSQAQVEAKKTSSVKKIALVSGLVFGAIVLAAARIHNKLYKENVAFLEQVANNYGIKDGYCIKLSRNSSLDASQYCYVWVDMLKKRIIGVDHLSKKTTVLENNDNNRKYLGPILNKLDVVLKR